MIGGFFDRYHPGWSDDDIAWFEALLDEDDVDVLVPPAGDQGQRGAHVGVEVELLAQRHVDGAKAHARGLK